MTVLGGPGARRASSLAATARPGSDLRLLRGSATNSLNHGEGNTQRTLSAVSELISILHTSGRVQLPKSTWESSSVDAV